MIEAAVLEINDDEMADIRERGGNASVQARPIADHLAGVTTAVESVGGRRIAAATARHRGEEQGFEHIPHRCSFEPSMKVPSSQQMAPHTVITGGDEGTRDLAPCQTRVIPMLFAGEIGSAHLPRRARHHVVARSDARFDVA